MNEERTIYFRGAKILSPVEKNEFHLCEDGFTRKIPTTEHGEIRMGTGRAPVGFWGLKGGEGKRSWGRRKNDPSCPTPASQSVSQCAERASNQEPDGITGVEAQSATTDSDSGTTTFLAASPNGAKTVMA